MLRSVIKLQCYVKSTRKAHQVERETFEVKRKTPVCNFSCQFYGHFPQEIAKKSIKNCLIVDCLF